MFCVSAVDVPRGTLMKVEMFPTCSTWNKAVETAYEKSANFLIAARVS